MTMFSKTLVGKAIGKVGKAASKVASISVSPNPVMAGAGLLLSGKASEKKQAATEKANAQKQQKKQGKAETETTTNDNFFKRNKKILGITFPLWIWLAIVVAGGFMFYWLAKKFLFKRKGSGVRRRSSGSSSMKSRMARVRSYRRKRK